MGEMDGRKVWEKVWVNRMWCMNKVIRLHTDGEGTQQI